MANIGTGLTTIAVTEAPSGGLFAAGFDGTRIVFQAAGPDGQLETLANDSTSMNVRDASVAEQTPAITCAQDGDGAIHVEIIDGGASKHYRMRNEAHGFAYVDEG